MTKTAKKPQVQGVTVKAAPQLSVQEYVTKELTRLTQHGFVATPDSREALEQFAKANGGTMDMLLMQKAIQFGAKLAFQNVQEVLGNK
jgi:hypothetical protein